MHTMHYFCNNMIRGNHMGDKDIMKSISRKLRIKLGLLITYTEYTVRLTLEH